MNPYLIKPYPRTIGKHRQDKECGLAWLSTWKKHIGCDSFNRDFLFTLKEKIDHDRTRRGAKVLIIADENLSAPLATLMNYGGIETLQASDGEIGLANGCFST
jgi:hypothetical protein